MMNFKKSEEQSGYGCQSEFRMDEDHAIGFYFGEGINEG